MKIDLKRRTINGKEAVIPDVPDYSREKLIELYNIYKYSIPSGKKAESKYFKALTFDEIPDDKLVPVPREWAKEELEKFMLANIMKGNIPWDDSKWFVVVEDDLVLLREWIKGE